MGLGWLLDSGEDIGEADLDWLRLFSYFDQYSGCNTGPVHVLGVLTTGDTAEFLSDKED